MSEILALNMIGLMALRNVGVDCLYMQLCFFFLPRSLNVLFRNLYFMNLILKTKYIRMSIEFLLAQVRGNNHWRTSRVRLKILNYRTLKSKLSESQSLPTSLLTTGFRSKSRNPRVNNNAFLRNILFSISLLVVLEYVTLRYVYM